MQLSLKEWRRLKGISQEEMANICDVHVNTYRAWEENPADIKISKAVLICDRLGVNMSDVLFLSEDTTKSLI